jgi:hydroxymethylpyrimidine pyrophosphatase-like HAD family hydrolase
MVVVGNPREILAWGRELSSEVAHVQATTSVDYFLEITRAGVDKGAALRWLMRDLGVSPEEAAAAGDGRNDVPVLEQVAMRIAVEGSPEELMAIAGAVIPPPGEGAISALAKILLG